MVPMAPMHHDLHWYSPRGKIRSWPENSRVKAYEYLKARSRRWKRCAGRWQKQRTSAGCGSLPFGRLSDGTVIGFGLALAEYVMNPRLSVIDREDFAAKFDKVLTPYLDGLAHCTDDVRLARINLCVAAASQVSGYDADEPLRAATPEGGEPS